MAPRLFAPQTPTDIRPKPGKREPAVKRVDSAGGIVVDARAAGRPPPEQGALLCSAVCCARDRLPGSRDLIPRRAGFSVPPHHAGLHRKIRARMEGKGRGGEVVAEEEVEEEVEVEVEVQRCPAPVRSRRARRDGRGKGIRSGLDLSLVRHNCLTIDCTNAGGIGTISMKHGHESSKRRPEGHPRLRDLVILWTMSGEEAFAVALAVALAVAPPAPYQPAPSTIHKGSPRRPTQSHVKRDPKPV
ncbi:hypothetical protein JHW43_006544 [Diplocarpon mali]|nr:hypothetical protein JHW43_006544 [Diplocarpon mali]